MKVALLALCTTLILAATAHAQLAVYRLTFKTTGTSVNYQSYQDGYYVTPATGGTGSLILLQKTGSGNLFYTFTNFGQTFIASDAKGGQKMVLTAVSSSSAADTTLFAIGNVDQSINFITALPTPATNGQVTGSTVTSTTAGGTTTSSTTAATANAGTASGSVQVASNLTGFEITADSQSDMPFIGNSTVVGVAGASVMKMSIQAEMSTLANSSNFTLVGEVTYIENLLQEQGYASGGTTSTAATTTGTTTTGG